MPTPTVDEFWGLLIKSGLVDAGAVEVLRREHTAAPVGCGGDTPKGIAGWLVSRGVITPWQAKRLAIGNLGPFFLGDYRLLERHDREGDALLFTARHEPSGRTVSVVLLNTKRCRQLDVWTEIVQRTTAAIQATDPMLSRTWSLEQHESSRLIVCEHVEGTTLANELGQHGPLPSMQAGVLVSQIARAVADLHSHGSVHGNLSLNVLLREPPPGGVPRTGRVRLMQFPLTGDPHRIPLRPWKDKPELVALGRLGAYVAPELMLPNAVCDVRSDVYSIGAILYALLSGALPCWEGDAEATLRRAAFGEGPKSLKGTAVSDEMATLVGYLMARDPNQRYQSAAEAADAIAACLGMATGAGAAAVRLPAALPEADAGPVTLEDMPDFAAAAASGAVAAGSGPMGLATGKGSATAAATVKEPPGLPAEIRRRRTRLRFVGGGVTLLILAGTAALVVSRLKPWPKPVPVVVIPTRKPSPNPVEERGSGLEGETLPGETIAPGGSVAVENPPAGGSQADVRQIVVDDQELPWASPTEGPPPKLSYLPPGAQLILLARPADLFDDEEGRRFVESLGPQARDGLDALAGLCGCERGDIELVQAGWQAGGPEEVLGGYAVRLVEGKTVITDRAARSKAWGPTQAVDAEGEPYYIGKPFSFWVPSAEANCMLVVVAEPSAGPEPGESLMKQVVQQAAAFRDGPAAAIEAELPVELEQVVGMLDAKRHLTLFGSPHYLLTQGRVVLAGPLAKLARPLEDLFGESLKGVALSVHIADHLYLELDAIAGLDKPANSLTPELAARVEGLSDTIELYCASLNLNPYGRVLVWRLPSMMRVLAANLRSGVEGKGAVLNAYLPRQAGHNLALAAELALAQSPGVTVAAAGPSPGPAAATDALGKLEQTITLSFAKDTLEKTIQMISEEVGVPMEILGPDLQLEGITKNQSFSLDARDKPARQVLLEVLTKSNPDGKLVYVVLKEKGVETIQITTRSAVKKRGDTLPPGFEAAATEEKKKKS